MSACGHDDVTKIFNIHCKIQPWNVEYDVESFIFVNTCAFIELRMKTELLIKYSKISQKHLSLSYEIIIFLKKYLNV
jgi:hypothetical protein